MQNYQTPKRNPYHVLEVSPQARQEVIHGAYRELMKIYHPDGSAPDEVYAKEVIEAYEVLKDTSKRHAFDFERNKLVGKTLGEYKIESEIAQGATGTTYKAAHVLTGMPVCIKRFLIAPELRQIALEEAAAMWDLRHYGIPQLRNIHVLEDDSVALVMSYIPGLTLEQVIAKVGKLDADQVAWITERILNVLMYLHYEEGIVHGDIKPQNIIIQHKTHKVVVVDFGLSAIRPKSGDFAKGYTQYFASPEEQEGRTILPESDFYSLGMVMIYALGGTVDVVKRMEVPQTTPDSLCELIKRFIRRDVLSRPRWPDASGGGENLCETIQKVRYDSFGTYRSGLEPIPGLA